MLDRAIFVVAGQVAVLAEALRVVRLVGVRAGPGFLGAALTMVAVNAHALGVVGLVGVRALDHLLFLDRVRTFIAWHELELPAPICIRNLLLTRPIQVGV